MNFYLSKEVISYLKKSLNNGLILSFPLSIRDLDHILEYLYEEKERLNENNLSKLDLLLNQLAINEIESLDLSYFNIDLLNEELGEQNEKI